LSETQTSENGSGWAAILSASVGGFAFGVVTDLSEISPRISKFLAWYRPAGGLSGVAISAIVIWLLAWAVLHSRWSGKQIEKQNGLATLTCVLVILALVATFPPFYELL
jgi:hypothetical protein